MSNQPTADIGLMPYLAVKNAAKAIEFYTALLGAKELYRLTAPDGKIGHCELRFGDTTIAISEEFPGFSTAPETIGGTSVRFCLDVDDVDATLARLAEAGATITNPAKDQFYGYRSGNVRDPFGHEWIIMRKIEDVSPAEMQRRFDEMCK